MSLELVTCCENYNVDHVAFSDHCIVSVQIGGKRNNSKEFSWELWKLNAKLLQDEIFSETVKNSFSKYKDKEGISWGEKWELFKQDIKMSAIERAGNLKHIEKENEQKLRSNLGKLLNLECQTPGLFRDKIAGIKSRLEAIDKERYRGATVRVRAERLLFGEMPTKRTLSDEMKYAKGNEIEEIVCHGVLTLNKKCVEEAFIDYYRNLLSKKRTKIDVFKQRFLPTMPRLEEETKEKLEEPITMNEIHKAIDELKSGKSPDPGGIIADFYKMFSDQAASFLFYVFKEAYTKQLLPPSFSRTYTVLIPKSDDRVKLQSVSGYRPITLANVDYKILMKVLARRMQGVITSIVGSHQTCGIRGRSIVTNIHVTRSVLQCCDLMFRKVAMLQIDFEKAFDRVSHEVLFCILQHVNVGDVLLAGIRMAYQNCSTQQIVNKSATERIPVLPSVRQGCPLSPLLFCIFLEPFCMKIIQSESVGGFRLHSSEVRLLTYADDVFVFCKNAESVTNVIAITKEFCAATNSSVNWGKYSGFWHGEWASAPVLFETIKWSTSPVRYLGVPLESYRNSNEYRCEKT